jgi:isoleucyl-tRNA synthetase
MSRKSVFEAVPGELNFPAEEATIASFWKSNDVFARTLSAETRATGPSKGPFVFYEGPPTANGMPHNGHALTRSIKDVVPRYKTMCGYDVPRKAGWDTHGLPVEVEVEKDLGIHGKAEIEAYGIKPFVQKCIESVFRYTEAWERNTELIGYWLDTENAYVTYHQSYVESVWWALSELHKKGLLYRGHKVCWWWPQGGTALSAAEVGWNYKTVDDPSAYVALPLVDEPGTHLCVWTTTPWTLPSNGYAAVKGELDYAVCEWKDGKRLIVAEALREGLAKKLGLGLDVLYALKGKDLVGRRYQPCFDTYASLVDTTVALKDGGEVALYFRVIDADFVTLDAGTGIVHIAPAFGEDDNNAHKAELRRYREPDAVPLLCAVGADGRMSAEVAGVAGSFIKEADPKLLADLDARGLLVFTEKYRHEYPYCWRADEDPLIQLARPAWYIRTTERIGDALANNQAVTWLPEHIKEGRFGDFLRNNVDWALSRERYWGTPLNVWVCEGCGHEHAPASVAEIESLNPTAFDAFRAARAADPSLNPHLIVHKPWIDEVTLPCANCNGTMRRVSEVIDCWFDSGCMPFAQLGFPHREGSVEAFGKAWPADFISEAIDQTRGWFYSLLMISTLVFDEETRGRFGLAGRDYPHPYKACVVLGHVGDREGKKESKSKGNYTPPDIILERVRMEFAPVSPDDAAVQKLLKGKAVEVGSAYVAREDYEGLDLAGDEARVTMYRGDREAEGRTLVLKAQKGLPRRVIVMAAEDAASFGVKPNGQGLGVKVIDVPRLPQDERVYVEDPTRPAPGADAFRWFFYASSPPWTNTRHSLSNVRLQQKDFLIKLRNVYSFFVIYANIDGFDPAQTKARPVAERSLLDRWIASEVALTVRAVRVELDRFGIYEAAQRVIDLVDALSNWYVRRSRNRFWAPADDAKLAADKLDATATLYETLVTLAKLVAPFVPFFAEGLYQNLVRRAFPDAPVSVHLVGYPEADVASIDEGLAAEMRAIRELVSLGLQVRTDNRLRVRQPLSRADVVVSDASLAARLGSYGPLVAEELNVHEVRFLEPGQEAGAVQYRMKPNFRALGPRIGKKVQALKQALERADAGKLHGELSRAGKVVLDVDGEAIDLSGEELDIQVVASEGFAAAGGRVGVVVLHTELTDALRDEGLARDVLAKVQQKRKDIGLGFTDRLVLTVFGGERIARVVEAARASIAEEALCSLIVVKALAEAPPSLERLAIEGEELALDGTKA